MAENKSEDKKPDFSNIPRGAIGMKGIPVNRNTRLPSIRSPRDLTLGAQPKKIFVPNIPVRRDKRSSSRPKTESSSPMAIAKTTENRVTSNDRWRNKGKILQTEGSVFGEGIAAASPLAKVKHRDIQPRMSPGTSSKSHSMKKVKKENSLSDYSDAIKSLLRDDFIDDEDNEEDDVKPVIYPLPQTVKKEQKKFGNEIDEVAKFIKKEEGVSYQKERDEKPLLDSSIFSKKEDQLLIFQLPEQLTVLPDSSVKGIKKENNANDDTKSVFGMPPGYIGKLQILKSGKSRLIISDAVFENDDGPLPLSVNTEVVSVQTENHDMVIVGNVTHKLIFAPNIANTLENLSL